MRLGQLDKADCFISIKRGLLKIYDELSYSTKTTQGKMVHGLPAIEGVNRLCDGCLICKQRRTYFRLRYPTTLVSRWSSCTAISTGPSS